MLLGFQKQFAEAIRSGAKMQTIRQRRKDGKTPQPGETLFLYTGLRTSSTMKLGERACSEVFPVYMDLEDGIIVSNGIRLNPGEANSFARLDGFDSFVAMLNWFRETYKPATSFNGHCIRWRSAVSEDCPHG